MSVYSIWGILSIPYLLDCYFGNRKCGTNPGVWWYEIYPDTLTRLTNVVHNEGGDGIPRRPLI